MSDPSFVLTNNSGGSTCLLPGQKDTLLIHSQLDTTGSPTSNSSTLTITSNASTQIPPITLSRSILYPTKWGLTPLSQQSSTPPAPTIITIQQQGSLPADVTSVDFTLNYNGDILQFLSVDEPNVNSTSIMTDANNIAHQTIHFSPITTSATLATLHFATFVAKSFSTGFSISNIQLSTPKFRPQDCIAAVALDSLNYSITTSCGDVEYTQVMSGSAITFDEIRPNPATSTIALRYSSLTSTTARLTIQDVLGRTVSNENLSILKGANQHEIDLRDIPSGCYTIRIVTAEGMVVRRFLKE